MRRKHRSRLAILSAALLAVAGAVGQPQPSAAASTGGSLFGLSYQAGQVVTLDPATGQYTVLADLPVDPSGIVSPTFFGLASDAAHHKLFTVRATYNDPTFQTQLWQVVIIDTTTGSTTISPALSQSFNDGLLSDWAFDPSTGVLFGVVSPMVSPHVVKVDLATGLVSHVADLPGTFVTGVTFAPDKHQLFVVSESQPPITPDVTWAVVTVNTATGTVSSGPALSRVLLQLVYDSSSGTLFGKGGYPDPTSIFSVDPATGSETAIGPALGFSFGGITIDSASHTIYLIDDEFSSSGVDQLIETINDQTGAYSVSTGTVGTGQFINNLAFEGVAADITPASVRDEVQQAFASGLIRVPGLQSAILSQLDAAAAARARGQCATAGRIYAGVVNTVQALSNQQVDPSFASHLTSDLQFLIGHCP